jgi:hypothetical protein
MSMSPEQRADDRLITLISRWLARHIGNAELEHGLADTDRSALAPGQHLKGAAPGQRGELEMIARETLEALAVGL